MVLRCKPLLESFRLNTMGAVLLERCEAETLATIKRVQDHNYRATKRYEAKTAAYLEEHNDAREDLAWRQTEAVGNMLFDEELADDQEWQQFIQATVTESVSNVLRHYDLMNGRPKLSLWANPITKLITWSDGVAPPPVAGQEVVIKRQKFRVREEHAQSVSYLARNKVDPPIFIDLTDLSD